MSLHLIEPDLEYAPQLDGEISLAVSKLRIPIEASDREWLTSLELDGRAPFALQQRRQSSAAIARMFQVQLVEPAHQRQVLFALRDRLVIEAAARDANQLALLAQAQFGAWLNQVSPDRYRPSCLHFF